MFPSLKARWPHPFHVLAGGAVLLAGLALAGPPAADATTSFNQSLESVAADGVPTGWWRAGYGRSRAQWTVTSDAHAGRRAQRLQITSWTSGDRKLLTSFGRDALRVEPGARYDLSAWYRTDGIAELVVFRRSSSGSWSYWTGGPTLPRARSYQRAALRTPLIPTGTTAISFGIALRSVGTLTTDDYGAEAVSPSLPRTAPPATTAPVATTTVATTAPVATTTVTTTTTTPTPTTVPGPSDGQGVLLRDRFDRADGLITNEYATYNPDDPAARLDATWELNSGSLFAAGGNGYSGEPDDQVPDARSTTSTGSAILRAVTKVRNFTDVDVALRLKVDGFSSTPSTPPVDWDGVHVFLRYESEASLYYASVDRRDGTTAIKKKVPGGPSNGGTYYTLASGSSPVPLGRWQDVRASIVDAPDGSVGIELWIDGARVLAATDRGTGGPVIRSGALGIRGDNCRFWMDDLVVTQR